MWWQLKGVYNGVSCLGCEFPFTRSWDGLCVLRSSSSNEGSIREMRVLGYILVLFMKWVLLCFEGALILYREFSKCFWTFSNSFHVVLGILLPQLSSPWGVTKVSKRYFLRIQPLTSPWLHVFTNGKCDVFLTSKQQLEHSIYDLEEVQGHKGLWFLEDPRLNFTNGSFDLFPASK